jgi:hypothetical protein
VWEVGLKRHQWCSCGNSGSCGVLVRWCFGEGGPVVNEGMDVELLALQSSSIVFMPILAQAKPWEIWTWWWSQIKEPPRALPLFATTLLMAQR